MATQFAPQEYTVMVVDSDCQVCASLAALLQRAGYRTRTFRSGEAVLDDLAAFPARACVITEIQLPGINGLELIARLRQANITAPTVVLTALGDVATAVRAMRDSVADYLVKPYVERDLVNRLQLVLSRQGAAPH